MSEQFEFRTIKQEADEAAEIERICFPPQEACTPQRMRARIGVAADLFLVAAFLIATYRPYPDASKSRLPQWR